MSRPTEPTEMSEALTASRDHAHAVGVALESARAEIAALATEALERSNNRKCRAYQRTAAAHHYYGLCVAEVVLAKAARSQSAPRSAATGNSGMNNSTKAEA